MPYFTPDHNSGGGSGQSGFSGYSGQQGTIGLSGYSGETGCAQNYTLTFSFVNGYAWTGTQLTLTLNSDGNWSYINSGQQYSISLFYQSLTNRWVIDIEDDVHSCETTYFADATDFPVCPPVGASNYSIDVDLCGIGSTVTAINNDYSVGTSSSGYSGYSGKSGANGSNGISGFSGYSGITGGQGSSGFSGYSGKSGFSGYSGTNGAAGSSGFSGYSGPAGANGTSGFSGYIGISGYSGTGSSGFSGYSGKSGFSGYSGSLGASGFSGYSGKSGFSGYSGLSGHDGCSFNYYIEPVDNMGFAVGEQILTRQSDGSWTQGDVPPQFSITNDGSEWVLTLSGNSFATSATYTAANTTCPPTTNGNNDGTWTLATDAGGPYIPANGTVTNDYNGGQGANGVSGFSGYSGKSGFSGYSGAGLSGFSGYSGKSGFSGYSGTNGTIGSSGFSGYSGLGSSGFSGYSGFDGCAANYIVEFTTACVASWSGINNTLTRNGSQWSYNNVGLQYTITLYRNGANWQIDVNDDVVACVSSYQASAITYPICPPVGASNWTLTSDGCGFGSAIQSITNDYSGTNGTNGASGFSGQSGTSGKSGFSGYSGKSGFSGYSGIGLSGFSGYSGTGNSGFSGYSGVLGSTLPSPVTATIIQNSAASMSVFVSGTGHNLTLASDNGSVTIGSSSVLTINSPTTAVNGSMTIDYPAPLGDDDTSPALVIINEGEGGTTPLIDFHSVNISLDESFAALSPVMVGAIPIETGGSATGPASQAIFLPVYEYSCFLSGTPILMPDGTTTKPIEQVVAGDKVLSMDERSRFTFANEVTYVYTHPPGKFGYLIVNETLKVTMAHPMYINDTWMPIYKAQIGDYLIDSTGKKVWIYSIEYVADPQTTYNFKVKNGNQRNYFAANLLVHNKCPFLYVFDNGQWIYQNTFIYGLDSKEKEAIQLRPLKTITNHFVVRELESEVSYIKSLTLIATTPSGVVRSNWSNRPVGEYVIVKQGEYLKVEFEPLPADTTALQIEADGYYLATN